jgi:hypothetical protein
MSGIGRQIDQIMQEATDNLQIPHPVARVLMTVAVELLEQRNMIEALGERLDAISTTSSNQYERHSNHLATVRREIERLKGIHGA